MGAPNTCLQARWERPESFGSVGWLLSGPWVAGRVRCQIMFLVSICLFNVLLGKNFVLKHTLERLLKENKIYSS